MSKKHKKAEKEHASDTTPAVAETGGSTPEGALSKKERKAIKKAAEKAAREADAQARKDAERAEKAARRTAKAAASTASSTASSTAAADGSAAHASDGENAKAKAARESKPSKKSKPTKKSKPSKKADGETVTTAPRFKHLRKKKLASGKGATPREIGESLVALFNAGKADEAERTWYHRKIESIEADGSVFEGVKGVAEKSAWWTSRNTIVAAKAEGPFVCSTGFTVLFTMTVETAGARSDFREAGVYTVEKGRIVREQFMGA